MQWLDRSEQSLILSSNETASIESSYYPLPNPKVKRIYRLNSFLTSIFEQSLSWKALYWSFYTIAFSLLCLFIVAIIVEICIYDNRQPVHYRYLSFWITTFIFYRFETTTTKFINERLKIVRYRSNFFLLSAWILLVVVDGWKGWSRISTERHFSSIVNFFLSIGYYSIALLLLTMTLEAVGHWQAVRDLCGGDEVISIRTLQTAVNKETVMSQISSVHVLVGGIQEMLEFKLVMQVLFSIWYGLHFWLYGRRDDYRLGLCELVLLVASMLQPLSVVCTVDYLERRNKVRLSLPLKVAGVAVNWWILLYPTIGLLVLIVSNTVDG